MLLKWINIVMRIPLIVWAAIWVHGISYAALPELSSDEPIEFDQKNKKMTARGNAMLEEGDLQIQADEMQYDSELHVVKATGQVEATRKEVRILSEEAQLDLDTYKVSVDDFRLGRDPFFVEGEHIEGDKESLTFTDSSLYFGEPDAFSFNIYADEFELGKSSEESFQPDMMKAKRARLRIGKFPFFFLPYYRQNFYESPIEFNAEGGNSNILGYYLRTNSYLRLTDMIKVGALFDYYTKRGFLFGPALEYESLVGGPSDLKGSLVSGYIRDKGGRTLDINGRRIGKNRGFIEWRHQHFVEDRLTMTSSMSYWSDSEVERDFRPSLFEGNQQPDSFAEINYLGRNYSVSAFGRLRINKFQRMQERLPEVSYDLYPTPLGESGVYQKARVNFVHLQQRPVFDTERNLWSDRVGVFYNLSRPIALTPWMTFVPVVGGRIDEYLSTNGTSGKFTRLRGQVGFDLQMTMYGQWDYQNKRWGIDGVRHIMRPIVQYRYIPRKDFGTGQPPCIDCDPFTTNLRPIDLGEKRDLDEPYEQNLVRLGLENVLQTRTLEYGGRDLAYLNLYQDVRFKQESGQSTLSNFYTDFMLSPWRWLNFGVYSRVDPHKAQLQELRTHTRLIDGKVWQLDFITDNLIRATNQYYLSLKYRLNARAELKGQWRYNAKKRQLTEQLYGLSTRVSNSWLIEYELGHRLGSSRENEVRFLVKAKLLIL